MLLITTHPDGLSFRVHVQPGAARNQVLGPHGDALKLKLKAPPVEGRANKACIELLSEELEVPTSAVQIVSGQTSRRKLIRITCPASRSALLRRRLEELGAG